MAKNPRNSVRLYIAVWKISTNSLSNSGVEVESRKLREKSKARAVSIAPEPAPIPILLSFSAPDYGIMFRCRVVCLPNEGMATVAVTGLRFLEVSLKNANIEEVTLCIDSPTYYFQVTGQAVGSKEAGAKAEMLQRYRKKFKLDFKLVERVNNPARHHCLGLPTTPSDVRSPLLYNPLKWPQKGKMMTLQNGIVL